MTRNRICALVAGATTALALLSAGPVAADSIVYEKQNNIWIANPDGSGQYQVTTDGTAARPYGDPSQADDGTIVAGQGQEIVKLRQNGQALARFNPPATTDSAGQYIDGVPQDLSVSPDGSKVAFSYYQYGCPPGVSCGARTVLLYSSTSAATPVAQYGKQYRRNASWVSNNRILAFGGYQSQVNLDSPGGGNDDDQHWFDDEDLHRPPTDLGDGELSRQGDRLVTLRNYGADTHMQFYAVSGNVQGGAVPGPPAEACFSGKDAGLDSPTWSHNGRAVAFAVSTGIELMALPSVTPGNCSGAGSSRLVIPGGAEPDFGPAAVNPGPRTPTAGGGGTGGVAGKPKAKGCKRLRGVKRDRCVRKAALAKCSTLRKKSKRKRCAKKAHRAFALKACARKPKSKRSRCVRVTKRRYR